jgi:hypothetical protein
MKGHTSEQLVGLQEIQGAALEKTLLLFLLSLEVWRF